jgi:CelD/BcsL family acetyltransferase involved in cellulose biosynthesis
VLATQSTAPVEIIHDVPSFAKLRSEWNRLLSSSRADCLFLTWEWLYTWWRHLSGDRQLHLITVRDGDHLIAIAPCAVSPRFRFGHPLETLEFLGAGFVGSDYLDFIVERGSEEIAQAAFRDYLGNAGYALRWTNVGPNSFAAGLAACLAKRQWGTVDAQINVCPYLPLSGLTWDTYLAGLGAEHRYNFRRKWQRVNRDFRVRWGAARAGAETREAIDIAIALHNRRWSERGQSDAFHLPDLVTFHREFAPLAADLGWLRLYTLRLDDHPAASLYGFLYRGKFYFYQSGFDTVYAKHSVGLLAMGLSIQEALAENATEFDLLHGNETYKSHWARAVRALTRLELYPSHALGRLSGSTVELIRSARRMASGVLNSGQ